MSKELAKKEGQNIFDIMTGVAIFIFIKNPDKPSGCEIFYHDIGDNLTRAEKLHRIVEADSIEGISWSSLVPNDNHDWINQRDPAFQKFVSIGDKSNSNEQTIFSNYSLGVATNRDAWAYNFSRGVLTSNLTGMINFYGDQLLAITKASKNEAFKGVTERQKFVEDFIENDPKKISWTHNVKNELGKLKPLRFDPSSIVVSAYRPFCKQYMYFNRALNERVYQMPKLFPEATSENLVICVPNIGGRKPFSALIVKNPSDLNFQDAGAQSFPLFTYQELGDECANVDMFSTEQPNRVDNVTDGALKLFTDNYGDKKIFKEDIFYYVYGILHSPEYKQRFDSDLKKVLPRMPFAKYFWVFSNAGRELAKWHLNYETVEPYELAQEGELSLGDPKLYELTKMSFAKIDGKEDRSTIIYNSRIKLGGIPLEAYDYIVSGKSAIEWIIDRYKVDEDKVSGLKNDPNDWCSESGDPEYIVNLIKRVVRVSLETMKIVNSLPPIKEKK
jgi:predicted helicase